MKRIALPALAALLLPLLAAQKPGDFPRTMFVTFDKAPVYAEADYLSEIRGSLRLGDSLVVVGVKQKYFIVEFEGRPGYLLGTNLGLKPPKAKRVKQGGDTTASAVRSDSMATQRPARKRASAGAESRMPQCTAVTKTGKQCSRRASDSTGKCWQHRPKQ